MPCNHLNVTMQIVIERWTDVSVRSDLAGIDRDSVSALKILINCQDCQHLHRYNAYSLAWHAKNTYGAKAGERWPTWLLNRLIPVRALNAAVQEACQACGVPPVAG